MDEQDEDRSSSLGRFERAQEYFALLEHVCSHGQDQASSSTAAPIDDALSRLQAILDDYQEQPYLLDPYLDRMVAPPLHILQGAVRSQKPSVSDLADPRVQACAHLLWYYTKVRGYKTLTSYFPHEVSDVGPVVSALAAFTGPGYDRTTQWELRYILLLWLSLVCIIPFDLDKLAPGARDQIVETSRFFLDSPGKERDAAAVALGKVLQRRDVSTSHLPSFITWSVEHIVPPATPTPFLATGILQTLCELLKTAPAALVAPFLPDIQVILSMGDHDTQDSTTLASLRGNALVNRFRCKLATRMALTTDLSSAPPSLDAYVAQLLNGLEDKDTVVRYSAAKGLARICQRIPSFYKDQVVDAISSLFSINVFGEDLTAVSEHTWQGACLGLAEMARRGLLDASMLDEPLRWVQKSLRFDIRRGAHSVGAAVRDAACYVVWSLARAYSSAALAPYAHSLATTLVTVTLLDREIPIRRAASAAFQECVGRWSTFPHGIDVIGKTDFFAVAIRRRAFLECLPAVAIHDEYRGPILDQLLNKTVVHWDPAMRILGAQTLSKVKLDPPTLRRIISQMKLNCASRDTFVVHGSLLVLAEVAQLSLHDSIQPFCGALDQITRHGLTSPLVLEAGCFLIAVIRPEEKTWGRWVDAATVRKEETVHVAVQTALAGLSQQQRLEGRVQTVLDGWQRLPASAQQAWSLSLGTICVDESLAKQILDFLLALIDARGSKYSRYVESRRNAIGSLVQIAATQQSAFDRVVAALTASLEDYTTDQRGDVGSWVRMAAVRGLTEVIENHRSAIASHLVDSALAGIAKQMVERIDNIRAEATEHFLRLYRRLQGFPGEEVVRTHFSEDLKAGNDDDCTDEQEQIVARFKDPSHIFPRCTQLLTVPTFRQPVLQGLVQSLGTKTELARRVVRPTLIAFVCEKHAEFSGGDLVLDLLAWAQRDWAKSSVAVNLFQTLAAIWEDIDAIDAISDVSSKSDKPELDVASMLQRSLALCTRSLSKIKGPLRMSATLDLISAVLTAAIAVERGEHTIRLACIDVLASHYLCHEFATLRVPTAERLYMALQAVEEDEADEENSAEGGQGEVDNLAAEEILLNTPWSDDREDHWRKEAEEVRTLLTGK